MLNEYGCVLRWLSDETFFSICSRQHIFQGNIKSASTTAWLFDGDKAGVAHDFPFNLDALQGEIKATWGDATSIILDHTILPLFFPFQSRAHVEEVIEALRSPRLGSLKYRLGLLTGRFGAEHPLKACSACMISDRSACGVAYWHLTHQYPGIVLCPIHHLPLRESTKNRQWSGRFQWLLPDEDVLAPESSLELTDHEIQSLEGLGQGILQLANYGFGKSFNPDTVSRTYRYALSRRADHEQDQAGCGESFARYTTLLQRHPPLTSLPTTGAGAAALLGQLTRSPRGYCHPLKHLILISWLFGSLDLFVSMYDQQAKAECSDSVPSLPIESRIKNGVLQKKPPTRGTLKFRRPKILKDPIRLSILERLADGADKKSICSDFNISISTVNKLISSEPAIRESWENQRKLSLLIKYRMTWLSTTERLPDAGVKRIRSKIPHIYAWLYRNDLQWLQGLIDTIPKERYGNNSKVDWLERDRQMSEAIKASFNTGTEVWISKVDLNLRFPGLAQALQHDKHYPLTKLLVRQLTGKQCKKVGDVCEELPEQRFSGSPSSGVTAEAPLTREHDT
ncbi:TnsD family Tn7-like transposition protein [Pseudomonas sp. X10]